MPVTYKYATSRELQEVLPDKIARAQEDRLGFQICPIRGIRKAVIEYEQKENVRGLQQWRGLNGSPKSIVPIGKNKWRIEPGIYGEFYSWDEQTLTQKAGDAVGDVVVDIEDEILEQQDTLAQRELDRIESIIWLVLTTGTFAIAQPRADGTTVIVHTDTFAIQTVTASVVWSTSATATPLKNFRAVSLLGKGKGVSFRKGATAYMNQKTYNDMIGNTNAGDLGGQRINSGDTPESIGDFNKILLAQDLPQIVIYDEGYYDDDNNFVDYIPDGKVVVVGKRAAGQKILEYIKTRNMYAEGEDGQGESYSLIKNYMVGENAAIEIGKGLELHQGHNGALVLWYPASIVVMNV